MIPIQKKHASDTTHLPVGTRSDGALLVWHFTLSNYAIALRRGMLQLAGFQVFCGLLAALASFGIFSWFVLQKDLFDAVFSLNFWFGARPVTITAWFWLGLFFVGYFVYRLVQLRHTPKKLPIQNIFEESKQYTFVFDTGTSATQKRSLHANTLTDIAQKKQQSQTIDIATFTTNEFKSVIEDAYILAKNNGAHSVTMYHLLYELSKMPTIKAVCMRLGFPADDLQTVLKTSLPNGEDAYAGQDVSLEKILFDAYVFSIESRQHYVHEIEAFYAIYLSSEILQDILLDIGIDQQKVENVVIWMRMKKRLRQQYIELRKAGARRSKHGIDRAMTAVATPYLNQFSEDITIAAKYGGLYPCMGRDKEIADVFRVISAGRQSVMLVGNHGVGKKTIVDGIAQLMIEDAVPPRLYDKRLVQISVSKLLAGASVSVAQERLIQMLHECHRAGNVILFIDQIHNLVGAAEGGSFDVSSSLAEYLGGGNFLTIATTTPDYYQRLVANGVLSTVFSPITIEEMDDNQAIQALESKLGEIEHTHDVFFVYDAIASAVELAGRFIQAKPLPESALELVTEAASMVASRPEKKYIVQADDIAHVVTQKTGVPATSISGNERDKLLRLEEALHQSVIGQDAAVTLVANALRRARVQMRATNKPIATFLFLGPTGVGKTELAKTIAKEYFGGEERMIRLDMSEYQDVQSIYRLIGEPNRQGTGILTEAVLAQPFSLILLDELEKAHPDILNLFLQVFDDGRLTDSVGRVVDFTNTIIISTSNAGTSFVESQRQADVPINEIREQLIRGELKEYYRPEFINRFDGIVLFKPLELSEIKQIAGLMLKRVGKDLEKKGILFEVTDPALTYLAERGYDPAFGARPMRRVIQDEVENAIATLLLEGTVSRRDTIVLGEQAKPMVQKYR